MKNKFKILFFAFIFLYFFPCLLCFPKTEGHSGNLSGETTVVVLRGEVVVFPLYKEKMDKFADKIAEGEIVNAVFLSRIKEDVIYAYVLVSESGLNSIKQYNGWSF